MKFCEIMKASPQRVDIRIRVNYIKAPLHVSTVIVIIRCIYSLHTEKSLLNWYTLAYKTNLFGWIHFKKCCTL
jgi:hypothetical protein